MKLNARQMSALTAICDTFLPKCEGWPSASEMGIPLAIGEAFDFNPRASDRREFLQLLNVWDSRLHTLLAAGSFQAFSKADTRTREKVLLDWADSSLRKRRAAFQALRKAVGFFYVMLSREGKSAVWDRMRYPGPLGVQRPGEKRGLPVSVPDRDVEVSCEVCVIGSGAGGGVAAAVLAGAGKDVVVLEAGNYYDEADFDGAELSGFQRLYLEGGFAATADHSVGFLAGECVGGGTVVNYCTSFRTPDDIREEWASAGVPWFRSKEYTDSLDAVCNRLHVNREHNKVSAREEILQRGLQKLGWHCDAMPRNVTDCDEGKVCGYCGLGCAIGAKQSTTKTWLADAVVSGARIIAGTRAMRILREAGAVKAVEARTREGKRVLVKCKVAVVACGAIHTPALLLRSGLGNPQIGKNLHLHPVSNVCGVFDEEVRPWEGTLQAIYSDQFRNMHGNFGVKYETTSLQPVIGVAVMAWREPAQFRSLLEKLPNTSAIGVLLRDQGSGEVRVDAEGHPVSQYSLSAFDRRNLREGFLGAARILEAAGAKFIYSPHAKFCSYEPGKHGTMENFGQQMDAAGWDNGQLALFTFHIMGTARLGGSAGDSATNPEGETWETRGLYVMDGASFPSASGVNPMISIEAIAHRNASVLAAKIG